MIANPETHYRRLFDEVPIGLYRFTPDWQIIDANLTLVHMLRYPDRDSLCSVTLRDIYADVEMLKKWQQDLEREGVLPAYEAQLRRFDGTVFWMENNGRTIEVHDGARALFYEGSIQDITKRKEAESALRESEKLYRLIVETANEGIWLIDTKGVIKFINPQAAELLGYRVEEMIGRSAFDFLYEEDQDEALRRFSKRKEGHRAQAEFRTRRRDGSELRILSSSAPIHDKDGELTGLLGMLIDVTEQKRGEEERARLITEIETHQELLRSILANVPGIVWEAWWTGESPSQRTGFVNDYVETMLGYSVAEWLSEPDFWLSVIYEEDRERAKVESSEIIAGGERGSLEYRMVTKDGRVVWVETQFVVIKEEGRPIGLRGVTLDITERKQADAALQESEANYRILVESSPAIVYLCQPAPPTRQYMLARMLRYLDTHRMSGSAARIFG